mmetsp:Transcript_23832/g.77498  ORF Transcript_23832/g.77498 Transcript_23832/m.77498 type:complete len:465 (+) Transcript_23832:94-1488(+)
MLEGCLTRKRVSLFGLLIVTAVSSAAYSVVAPLLPQACEAKGLSSSSTAFVFGIFALVVLFASPILGAKMARLGQRKVLLVGLAILGVGTMLLALLQSFPSGAPFLVAATSLRVLQGFGSAATETASYALIARLFPEDVSFVLGLSETVMGVGFMLGPPLGSMLFELGGFPAPFVGLGLLPLLLLPLLLWLLPGKKERPGDDDDAQDGAAASAEEGGGDNWWDIGDEFVQMRQIACDPHVMITIGVAVLANGSYAFLEPTLEPRTEWIIEKLSLTGWEGNSVELSGVMFLVVSLLYMVASPAAGYLAARQRQGPHRVTVSGIAILSAGFLLIGPAPFVFATTQPSLASFTFALALIGLGQSLAMVPNFDSMVLACGRRGSPVSDEVTDTLGGLLNAAYSFGSVLGPTAAAVLVPSLGFAWACSIWSVVILAVGLFAVVRRPLRSDGGDATGLMASPLLDDSDDL